ncbi:MAG: hypothetical protein AAF206_30645, partial [Bacteroidota bacterium]
MMRFLWFGLIFLSGTTFLQAQSPLPLDRLTDLSGRPIASLSAEAPLKAFFFLSPECPLCENYAVVLKQLREEFPDQRVAFYGVFAGKFYSSKEIRTYLARFQVPVRALLDPDKALVRYFGATVT